MTLSVGDEAPDFELPQALDAGDDIKLSDYRGKSNVLLCFYPFDFSGPCGEQLPVYQAQSEKFENANCQVIGISVDSKFSHAAWAEKLGVEYPLLSDFPAKKTVESYGLLHEGGFSNRAIRKERFYKYRYLLHHLSYQIMMRYLQPLKVYLRNCFNYRCG